MSDSPQQQGDKKHKKICAEWAFKNKIKTKIYKNTPN